MHAIKTLAAAVAASLTLGACAAGNTSPAAMSLVDGPSAGRAMRTSNGSERAEPTTLRVTNYNWQDVIVYASRGSSRMRLGTVTSMNTSTFRVPQMMMASPEQFRLVVRPIGSTEGWQSPEMMLHNGDQLQASVQNSLGLSSVMVMR